MIEEECIGNELKYEKKYFFLFIKYEYLHKPSWRRVFRWVWIISWRLVFWVLIRVRNKVIIDNFDLSGSPSLPFWSVFIFSCTVFFYFFIVDDFFIIEIKESIQKVLVIFLHYILDLVEIFFRKLIRVFKNIFYFVVNCVKRVEILFF